MSNDLKNGISMQIYRLEAEIKSLREQLDIERNKVGIWIKELQFYQNLLKQKEDVIRELTDLLQRLIDGEKSFIKQYPRTSKNIESLLEKAKSLTTKDKWNQ